jgi:hypothetical protein
LDQLRYAEIVIEQAHRKTMTGELKWTTGRDDISANPTASIRISMKFDDEEASSAIWGYAVITHPVGQNITLLGNPASAKSTLYKHPPSALSLNRMNEIFQFILLDPREKEFEVAMKELCD